MTRIVVDSGCDLHELPTGSVAEYERVPLKIIVGDREFVDDYSLDIAEMMEAMSVYSGASRSACPSPDEWMTAFGDADEVFAMSISGEMSGSFNSLMAARDLAAERNPNQKIFIFDSKGASASMNLMIRKLSEFVNGGMAFDDICRDIISYRDRCRLTFALYSVENFVKNGRVSRLSGMASRILGIHIVCRADDGKLSPKHKCRGVERGYLKMLEEMVADGFRRGHVILSQSFNPEGAKRLAALICEKFKGTEVEIMPTSGLCSFYAEKQGLLVGYEV